MGLRETPVTTDCAKAARCQHAANLGRPKRSPGTPLSCDWTVHVAVDCAESTMIARVTALLHPAETRPEIDTGTRAHDKAWTRSGDHCRDTVAPEAMNCRVMASTSQVRGRVRCPMGLDRATEGAQVPVIEMA